MKMNSCHHEYDLIAYRLNMLGQKERKLIEEHITGCEKCQRAMEIELEIDNELSRRMDPGNIEDVVLQRLRVYKEIKIRSWWQYPFRVFLNTLTGFAIGFGIWIFIGNQFNNISWLTDLINAAGNNISANTSIYISSGLGVVSLLGGVLIAFRKSLIRFVTEL